MSDLKMSHGYGIPVRNSSVNVEDLHPTLAYRVALLLGDRRLKGQFSVGSGVRSYAEQKYLYDGYKAGRAGFNLAANPDRLIGTWDGVTFRGSYHLEQSNGFGYAVDLHKPWWMTKTRARQIVHPVGREVGLAFDVPGEWWHAQHFKSGVTVNGPLPPASQPSSGGQAMLIQYGFYSYLNEGWRYRFLSDPASVAVFKASGMPVANLSDRPSTWKALRKEALAEGRLHGESAEVAGSY